MQIEDTAIPDVKIVAPKKHGDARGFFSDRRYREDDATGPTGSYGRSKLAGTAHRLSRRDRLHNGWIDAAQLRAAADRLAKSNYGAYLCKLLDEADA